MAEPQNSHITYENFVEKCKRLWETSWFYRYILGGSESRSTSGKGLSGVADALAASKSEGSMSRLSEPGSESQPSKEDMENGDDVKHPEHHANYVLIAPEHFAIIQHIYEASQRQEIHAGQLAQMVPILHNINGNLSRLVDVTVQQQRELIQAILNSKSHVPYWLVLLFVLVVSIFAGALLVEKTGTTIKFSWPTGFEISHIVKQP